MEAIGEWSTAQNSSKIAFAQHCLSKCQKYMKLLENQKSMLYMSCQAAATSRPKLITAQIATGRQIV